MIGRPREFDVENALERAMKLFWRQGYGGTSMSDLTRELGITRPSLYAAFESKEGLFLKALDLYEARAGYRQSDIWHYDTGGRWCYAKGFAQRRGDRPTKLAASTERERVTSLCG